MPIQYNKYAIQVYNTIMLVPERHMKAFATGDPFRYESINVPRLDTTMGSPAPNRPEGHIV
jgi:hypothetical protein